MDLLVFWQIIVYNNNIMRNTPVIIIALFLLAGGAGISYAQSRSVTTGSPVFVPIPRLITPTSEIVDISAEEGILFKWDPKQIPTGGRRNYRFQLYEGYDTYADNLIFKKELDAHTFEIFIEKDKFKDGGVYTWSVRQRGHGPSWSSRAFYSFKVKK